MATKRKGKAPAASKAPAATIDELVSAAQAALEQHGAIAMGKLGPAQARSEVVERLVALGFEASAKGVRRPVRAQLLQALAHGAALRVKALGDHVVGGGKKELETACNALVAEGAASLVIRGTEATLLAPGPRVIAGDALKRLDLELKTLSKLAATAMKKPRAALLVSDVSELLERVNVLVNAPKKESSAVARVLRAVDEVRDEQMGLSFVPRVVRWLGAELDATSAKAALVEAASRGLLELRPEGGLGRLTVEELELCPPGPQGTRLSWAKRSERGEGATL